MRRSNKVFYKICMFACTVGVLSGCSFVPSVELTPSESGVITEYAAGVLMKYQRGHANGVMSIPGLDENDFSPTPTPVPLETVAEEIEAPETENDVSIDDEEALVAGTDEELAIVDETPTIPMNVAFGLDNAELSFEYCELCDTYPTSGDNLVFSMNATSGKDLLIMHFNLTNPTGEAMSCTTDLGDRKIRLIVNGEDRLRCMMTILTNDLMNYDNVIEAGASDDVVLVFEVNEGVEINSLTLSLVNNEETLNYNL